MATTPRSGIYLAHSIRFSTSGFARKVLYTQWRVLHSYKDSAGATRTALVL